MSALFIAFSKRFIAALFCDILSAFWLAAFSALGSAAAPETAANFKKFRLFIFSPCGLSNLDDI